jgi:hypothetical protein
MYNDKAVINRFHEGYEPITETGCWIWIKSTDKDGYGYITVNKVSERAHRMSYRIHKGEIPQGMCVCHTCDTPECVNPDHLFLATNQENTADKVRKGRQSRQGPKGGVTGENNPNAKLTKDDVVFILDNYSKKKGVRKMLAEKFGVNPNTIHSIWKGNSWRKVA